MLDSIHYEDIEISGFLLVSLFHTNMPEAVGVVWMLKAQKASKLRMRGKGKKKTRIKRRSFLVVLYEEFYSPGQFAGMVSF